jgi:hypothetical protein
MNKNLNEILSTFSNSDIDSQLKEHYLLKKSYEAIIKLTNDSTIVTKLKNVNENLENLITKKEKNKKILNTVKKLIEMLEDN